jgi:serine/threonine-protein kinase
MAEVIAKALTMDIDGPFLLPVDVVIIQGSELSERTRSHIGCSTDEFVITRPRSRSRSRVVDAEAASLLREFRKPRRIVEAVIEHSRKKNIDPEKTLESAFPLLSRLVNEELLVPADSERVNEIIASLFPGQQFAGVEVLDLVQVLEDTEVYKVVVPTGERAALKLARQQRNSHVRRLLEREEHLLRTLDGQVTPKLLGAGDYEGRSYLLLEWINGIDVDSYAAGFRERTPDRARQKDLCLKVLDAYVQLHEQGVLHGDVHAGNILLNDTHQVRVIDFGLATHPVVDRQLKSAPRGGVSYYFEPEYAAARLREEKPPPISAASEVYALGALLYRLLTGEHYWDFAIEKLPMYKQILQDGPLPFSARGIRPWPEMEEVLAIALRKQSADRYSTVKQFAFRVGAVTCPEPRDVVITRPGAAKRILDVFLDQKLDSIVGDGRLATAGIRTPPRSSVHGGEAGVGYFLYRVANARSDPGLLTAADLCSSRAMEQRFHADAFYCDEKGLSVRELGKSSLYHTAAGVFCVQALVSHAMGDLVSTQEAINGFLEGVVSPPRDVDLFLGDAGLLLGCALLYEATQEAGKLLNTSPLLTAGTQLSQWISEKLDGAQRISKGAKPKYLGVAHGWAGALYSVLRWCSAVGNAPPQVVATRLAELAVLCEQRSDGIRWPTHCVNEKRASAEFQGGWCHGAAGHVHLWSLAHRMFGDSQYLSLAEGTANYLTAIQTNPSMPFLCCGTAGWAYALLALYKLSGDEKWLAYARDLGERAVLDARSAGCPVNGLYTGDLGIALLCNDLQHPEGSAMPLFEAEGWPNPRRSERGSATSGLDH